MAVNTWTVDYKVVNWSYTIKAPKTPTIDVSKYIPSYIKPYLNCNDNEIPVENWSAGMCIGYFSPTGKISSVNTSYSKGPWDLDVIIYEFCGQQWCSKSSFRAEIKIDGVPIANIGSGYIIDAYFAILVEKVDDYFIYYKLQRKFYAPSGFQKSYIPYPTDTKYITDEQYYEMPEQLTITVSTPDTSVDLDHDATFAIDNVLIADTLLSFDRNSLPYLLRALVFGHSIFHSFTSSKACYTKKEQLYCCGRWFEAAIPVCFWVDGLTMQLSFDAKNNSIIFSIENLFSTFDFYPKLIDEQNLRLLTITNPLYKWNINQPMYNLGLSQFPLGKTTIKIEHPSGSFSLVTNTETINIKQLEGLKL